ncbi:putative Rrf2 family DNA-binding protein [Nocardia brasiliensis NBRC 14402]|uniref:RrF2 family transcriptional regulator n=1 Tax=Nocardia brasiliensis TaxID=37326 RepID=UPI0003124C96|nr:Rrf2 family transcriptional regulator [Nocardia brasiliensis]ASF10613.1 Rrf2 family transcriptional regulator [Nocardia brasiliensis]GAJ80567.1 putative Rrf2 family DNA-binding protein [Nocardia brasiliensis NBRC 14402]SUB10839.1 HTH-type transcriptional regulator iscR [Nocardia brasiliensis]
MHITAKVDYAVRTLLEIARASQLSQAPSGPAPAAPAAPVVKADAIATAQGIPPKVLETVLSDLRRAELVISRRGPDGGYWLARPAAEISIADVIRAIEGPLASVRGERPEDVTYSGAAESLQRVWIALRVNIRAVLENVSIDDIADGRLPGFIDALTEDAGAWARRERPLNQT